MLMKTDTLQDSLEKYRAKIAGSARNRAAAYELALASGSGNYKPGDQVSYYIKATPKKVPAYEAAKLASEFDPENRDENVDYYVAKLDDLVKKFSGRITTVSTPKQESLAIITMNNKTPHITRQRSPFATYYCVAATDDHADIKAEITKRHDEAVKRLQDWIGQVSIAAENRGYPEGAEYMAKLARDAGFQQAT